MFSTNSLAGPLKACFSSADKQENKSPVFGPVPEQPCRHCERPRSSCHVFMLDCVFACSFYCVHGDAFMCTRVFVGRAGLQARLHLAAIKLHASLLPPPFICCGVSFQGPACVRPTGWTFRCDTWRRGWTEWVLQQVEELQEKDDEDEMRDYQEQRQALEISLTYFAPLWAPEWPRCSATRRTTDQWHSLSFSGIEFPDDSTTVVMAMITCMPRLSPDDRSLDAKSQSS